MFTYLGPDGKDPDNVTITIAYTDSDNDLTFVVDDELINHKAHSYLSEQRIECDTWLIGWDTDFIVFLHSNGPGDIIGILTSRVKKTPERLASLLSCLAQWELNHFKRVK
jgi:hypothetical protein